MNILVIEDDPEMRDFLVQGLTREGHSVDTAADGARGLEAAEQPRDIIILDRMMPEMDGIEVLKALRARGVATPILMLSALGEVDHRVTGLQHGADDYLAKPFSFVELAARVEALHRRDSGKSETTSLQIADLHLDLITHNVTRDGEAIELWPLEYKLLEYLMRNAGRVVTRNMLLENVWNLSFDPQTNVVEVHMSRLRGKVDKGYATRLIHTVRGSGYVIRED
ncbi:MAG TPA: response regulator transcription factor [Spongiibacteraceae bacterium]|nr:response regulator transcription factor [Spongiibacteraceae bacterium]